MVLKNSFLKFLSLLAMILLLASNAVFLRFNTFRYFHFYDMCFGMDGGWRILNGQRPYVDFIYFSGPVYLYMHAFFFKVFGFGKDAILAHLVVAHSIVIILTYLIARRYIPRILSLLAAALSMTAFYWPVSFPWHDQAAHLWGILAITVWVWRMPRIHLNISPECPIKTFGHDSVEIDPRINAKNAFWAGAFLSVMAVLALMTKTNIGAAYGFVFFLMCCFSSQRKEALSGYFCGAAISGWLMLLVIADPREYFKQVTSYSLMTADQRLSGFSHVSFWLSNYYWAPLLIVLGNFGLHARALREWMVLLLGIFFVAIVSIVSGQLIPSANIFLWGVFMAVALGAFYSIPSPNPVLWRKRMYAVSKFILIAITFLFIGLSAKAGLELQAWKYINGATPIGDYAINAQPLKGWKCDGYKGYVLDELTSYIQQRVPKHQSIFILTDLQILYALTGHESYRGIPIFVFRENHMPVPGEQLNAVKAHLQNHLPDWIVTDQDSYSREAEYIGFKETLSQRYTMRLNLGYYALFRKSF